MKQSRYSFFVKNGSKVYAYNSLSNSLAIMTNVEYDCLESFISKKKDLPKDLEKSLLKGFFLLDDNFDEIEFIKNRQEKLKNKGEHFSLTIAPTLNCNFRCIYCYEKGHQEYKFMTKETENEIVEYIKKISSTLKSISITWYGGEPLLKQDTIDRISTNLIKIADQNGIRYSSNIVTNGYLIDEQVVLFFKKARITNCQITLDGIKENHDKRRFTCNGDGSFDVIISNLEKYGKDLPHTVIRVNVDKTNLNAVSDLKLYFKQKGLSNLEIIPAPTRTTFDCYSKDYCFSSSEYYSWEREQIKKGYDELIIKSVPSIRGNNCVANTKNGFVVDPDGDLYKCWCDIGVKNYSIGNISNIDKIDEKGSPIANFDPYTDKECSKCKVLPICLGGCFHDRYHKTFKTCSPYKENINQYIFDTAKLLQKTYKMEE